MIKIIIALLVVIMIAGIAGHFWQQSQQDGNDVSNQAATIEQIIPENSQPIEELTNAPKLHDAASIEAIDNQIKQIDATIDQNKQLLKQFEDEQQTQNRARTESKELLNLVAPIPDIEKNGISEKMEAKAWIALDLDQLAEAKQGDQFALPSIEGQAYQTVITRKKTLWNGDQSLRAKVYSANGEPFPFIMSANQQNGFLTYSTPQGTYEVNLKNGIGAVYSVRDIDKATENGKHNDVIDIRDF